MGAWRSKRWGAAPITSGRARRRVRRLAENAELWVSAMSPKAAMVWSRWDNMFGAALVFWTNSWWVIDVEDEERVVKISRSNPIWVMANL
jgi:hypothetical protein